MNKNTFIILLFVGLILGSSLTFGTAAGQPLSPSTTYVVNSQGDAGDASPGNNVCETANGNGICTLRAAIEEADAHVGADTIHFESDVVLITPHSPFPPLTDTSPTTIRDADGSYVFILGSNAGTDAICFEISSNGNKIQGLWIGGFDGNGVVINGGDDNVIGTDGDGIGDDYEGNEFFGSDTHAIYVLSGSNNRISGNFIGSPSSPNLTGIYIQNGISNLIGTDGDGISDSLEGNVIGGNDYYGIHIETDYNTIAGNYIGTNEDGDEAAPNGRDGIRLSGDADYNTIGTDGDGSGDADEMNLVSGNTQTGILLTGGNTDNNVIAGNYVGTTLDGSAGLGNNDSGIGVTGTNNRVGTDGDGVSDKLERNLVSGNGHSGIGLSGSNNTAAGNYIGTNESGMAAIPNGSGGNFAGIWLSGSDNTVGTDGDGLADSDEKNLISGNTGRGIWGHGDNHTIAGNFIGTTASGNQDLGNGSDGIRVDEGSSVTIGGKVRNSTNVISGNSGAGILLSGSNKVVIIGNLIGTDSVGEKPLPNDSAGIDLNGSWSNVIGGLSNATRNVIACNQSTGISLGYAPTFVTTNNEIRGNYIGVFRDGETPCGNQGSGIFLEDYSVDGTTIGGVDAGEGNIIANNLKDGIRVFGNGAIDNNIRGNAIYDNGEEGIDLGYDSNDGVTPNDSDDSDSGPNKLQNFPVLEGAVFSNGSLLIHGTLVSTPSLKFQVDFFLNKTCDPSGHGEGAFYLGQLGMTTDATGVVHFSTTKSRLPFSSGYLTSTATDRDGNTSEFSACLELSRKVFIPLVMR